MNRVKNALAAAALVGVGALGGSQLAAKPAQPALIIDTVKLSRRDLPDAGVEWEASACGSRKTVDPKTKFVTVVSAQECINRTVKNTAVDPLLSQLTE